MRECIEKNSKLDSCETHVNLNPDAIQDMNDKKFTRYENVIRSESKRYIDKDLKSEYSRLFTPLDNEHAPVYHSDEYSGVYFGQVVECFSFIVFI